MCVIKFGFFIVVYFFFKDPREEKTIKQGTLGPGIGGPGCRGWWLHWVGRLCCWAPACLPGLRIQDRKSHVTGYLFRNKNAAESERASVSVFPWLCTYRSCTPGLTLVTQLLGPAANSPVKGSAWQRGLGVTRAGIWFLLLPPGEI